MSSVSRESTEFTGIHDIYINREISWLKFNERVLYEALNHSTPILERMKFVSIFSSNLDEFFMIRVGSLYDRSLFEHEPVDNKTGLTPSQQLNIVYRRVSELALIRDDVFNTLSDELKLHGLTRVKYDELQPSDEKFLLNLFDHDIMPFLSPQIVDSRHPFPHIPNKQIYIALKLEKADSSSLFGIIPVNPSLPRIIRLKGDESRYILLEDVIYNFAHKIFDMYTLTAKTIFCVTRNADINADEEFYNEDQTDYRQHMKKVLKKRIRLAPVRIEFQHDYNAELESFLTERLNLLPHQVFKGDTPLDLNYIYELEDLLNALQKSSMLYPPYKAPISKSIDSGKSVLAQALKRDILLLYPYESFKTFLTLIKEASNDKYVTSIKITLYRVGTHSELIQHLINAAENGKDVTILLELRARFDEENNIRWAAKLEESGCRVIYGPDGYKVHSKICFITRLENKKVQYITQIGTGNYNEKTSNIYTDYSLITPNQEFASDAIEFFKNLDLSYLDGCYKRFLVAPNGLKNGLIDRIDTEIAKASSGKKASIIMKMNSLTDKDMIIKLMEASAAGVDIKLIIRGICCLLPGIEGKTDNIEVISIVGRFLEHSRVYCFGSDEDRLIFIGSSDLMTRSAQRRIELCVPVLDKSLADKIYNMLQMELCDTSNAHKLMSDGNYVKKHQENSAPFSSQNELLLNASSAGKHMESKHSLFSTLINRIFNTKGV